MKKIMLSLLFIVCLFALLFELTGNDPNNNWSFRTYVSYVTDNIEPLPRVTLRLETKNFKDFLSWLYDIISYPVEIVLVALKNIGVLLYGLLPIEFEGIFDPSQFGGGDGFGGGGGGAR